MSASKPGYGATPQARINAIKKQQRLNAAREERNKQLQQQIESWYSQFDTNRNGVLERDELRALLQHLHPDHAPDEKMLDWLIERATAIESFSLQLSGSLHGAVSRLAISKTVEKYDSVVRQKTRLDEIFGTADVDGSGKLERSEVLAMMNDLASKTPSLRHVRADEADVEWVLESCDMDNDKTSVSREELYQALATWKELAQTKARTEPIVEEKTIGRKNSHIGKAYKADAAGTAAADEEQLSKSSKSSSLCALL